MIAYVHGNRDVFNESIEFLKNYRLGVYDPDLKAWVLNRSVATLKKIKDNILYGSDKSLYQLANIEPPPVKTSAEIFLDSSQANVNQIINHFGINKMSLELFDFQKLGVATALYNLYESGGFLIVDEMGTGKTPSSIAVAYGLYNNGDINKILVLCPKNVKFQWSREINRFSNLKNTVIDGYNKDKRLEKYEEDSIFYIGNPALLNIDTDFKLIKELDPELIIVDEIHKFKNRDSKRSKRLFELEPNFRLGLSGTPVQNEPEDAYSIFNFVNPELFGKFYKFQKKYITMDYSGSFPKQVGYRNLFDLSKEIAPYMIRRTTEDVSDEMPNDHIDYVYVDITPDQKELHQEIDVKLDNIQDDIKTIRQTKAKNKKHKKQLKSKLEENEGKVMGLKMIQQEIADDLELLYQSETFWVQKMVNNIDLNANKNKLRKLVKIIDYVLKEKDEDSKIIVFSQFARMVNIIIDKIESLYDYKAVKIIGSMSEKVRDESVQAFEYNDDCKFLIASDAASTGYNLQVANYLINFDIPWNPTTMDQRNGRIKRIGSKWDDIYIYNLITKDSIDINIMKANEKKRNYFDSIIENTERQRKMLKKLTKKIS